MSQTPPAGWYPDTTRPGQQRYWDGQQWTGYTAPVAAQQPAHAVAGPALASFGQRLGAYLLDTVILMVPGFIALAVVLGVVFAGASASLGTTTGDAEAAGGLIAALAVAGIVILVLFWIAPFLYFVGFEGGTQGQTIGKWAMGIRVVDAPTASRMEMSRSWIRTLIKTFVSGFLALGYLWMLWDDENRTWHDMGANSRVIVAREPKVSFGSLVRSWTLRT